MSLPLADLRVLDLTVARAGPTALTWSRWPSRSTIDAMA